MATLGKTTTGASSSASSANKTAVSSAVASATETLDSGAARVWLSGTGSTNTKLVVYADSAGAPGNQLAESDVVVISNTSDTGVAYSFTGANRITITSGTTYWVGLTWQDPGTISVNLGRDNTASARQENSSYDVSPFGTPTAQSGPVAVYVTTVGVTTVDGVGTATLGPLTATGTGTATAAEPPPVVAPSVEVDLPIAFHVSLVARVPASSGAPTLVEVDRLVVSSVTCVDELNRPGSATLNCPVRSLSDDVKTRLADLRTFPSEVWVYADSTLAWAGEAQSLGIRGQTVQLNAVGLLGYLDRMGITADVTHTGVDQFTIGKGLVNTWQALSYGHYGIVTSGIGTSGVTRDRTYLQKDLKGVLGALTELAAVSDGFDFWVEPSTRALTFAYPQRGTDLSASVVVDARSITSANVMQSVTPADLVSDVGATSSAQTTAGAQVSLYSYRENAALRAVYGRGWRGQSFSDVSVQATLDGKGDAFLAARGAQMLQPGVTLRPNVGTGITLAGIRPGDTVAYSYDAGLGLQSGTYRVGKVTATVDEDGTQAVSLEFI